MEAITALRRATIAPVDEALTLEAVDISLRYGLATADLLVYATAQRHDSSQPMRISTIRPMRS